MTRETLVDYTALPVALRDGVRRYLEDGIQPGGFLTAVITNNLREAVLYADPEMETKLAFVVMWFLQQAPAISWGAPDRMQKWMEIRRAERTRGA